MLAASARSPWTTEYSCSASLAAPTSERASPTTSCPLIPIGARPRRRSSPSHPSPKLAWSGPLCFDASAKSRAAKRGEIARRDNIAQAGECITHRRLAEADALPRTRDVALSIKRVERFQQVQVEAGDIHRALIGHSVHPRKQPRCSSVVDVRSRNVAAMRQRAWWRRVARRDAQSSTAGFSTSSHHCRNVVGAVFSGVRDITLSILRSSRASCRHSPARKLRP